MGEQPLIRPIATEKVVAKGHLRTENPHLRGITAEKVGMEPHLAVKNALSVEMAPQIAPVFMEAVGKNGMGGPRAMLARAVDLQATLLRVADPWATQARPTDFQRNGLPCPPMDCQPAAWRWT